MRMSTAGTLKNKQIIYKPAKIQEGFTLIELTMVIILLGFMLSLTLPRLRDVALSDNLKNTIRKMTAMVNEIRYQAIKDNTEYYLIYDFGSNQFWVDSPYFTEEEHFAAKEGAFSLPSDIRVIDIYFKGGEQKSDGAIYIVFSKEGYIIPTIIHFGSNDGRRFTFVLRPFLGDVEVLEEYVGIEDVKL